MKMPLIATACALSLLCAGGSPVLAASFDCDAAGLSPNEQTICGNRTLDDQDVEMATMYTFLVGLFAMGQAGEMRDQQTAWLKQREACGTDVACIKAAYDTRIAQLQKAYDAIDKPI
ncbi:lysozyme inhibitor LprI family protein [Pseudooceanicola sp. HF7]|uniref:lysozyme inhibitor LprI family protein n=1 Tax=Pseudooceanicola sp. HF7 TaxID=2721560 RepID=UPI00158E4984|nr:lysozyme inhibitor LprI family protein [Pseudooceanicola sp. HF7]